jgi:aspartyl protease family protein
MLPVIIIGVAMLAAVLAFFLGETSVAGINLETTMPYIGAVLMASVLLAGTLGNYRGQASEGLKAVAGWLAIFLVVVAGYAFRFELASAGNRVVGVLLPGVTLFGAGGEVTVSRGPDGQFHFTVAANGKPMRMMFDTGASSVVLRAEETIPLGITLSEADYTITVRTANGVARAAPITLKSLEIGGIREENVRAMVAKPGVLGENLLGMTFLERLSSYEVRGDQLALRGRGQ